MVTVTIPSFRLKSALFWGPLCSVIVMMDFLNSGISSSTIVVLMVLVASCFTLSTSVFALGRGSAVAPVTGISGWVSCWG